MRRIAYFVARRTSVCVQSEIDDYLKNQSIPKPMKQEKLDILLRNEITFAGLSRVLPKLAQLIEEKGMTIEAIEEAEIQIKYNGYIQREKFIAEKLHRSKISPSLPISTIIRCNRSRSRHGRNSRASMTTIVASRIPKVSPADVNICPRNSRIK